MKQASQQGIQCLQGFEGNIFIVIETNLVWIEITLILGNIWFVPSP